MKLGNIPTDALEQTLDATEESLGPNAVEVRAMRDELEQRHKSATDEPMTRETLLRELLEISHKQKNRVLLDPECQHQDADTLLLAFICDDAITRAFDKIERFYA